MESKIESEIITLYDVIIKLNTCITHPVNFKNINIAETRIIISVILFFAFLLSDTIIKLIFGSLGFITSYQLYYIYGSRKTGDVWSIKIKQVNLHHWIYCFSIFIIMWLCGIAHPFITGLCFGGITHGVQYSDWSIIYKL